MKSCSCNTVRPDVAVPFPAIYLADTEHAMGSRKGNTSIANVHHCSLEYQCMGFHHKYKKQIYSMLSTIRVELFGSAMPRCSFTLTSLSAQFVLMCL